MTLLIPTFKKKDLIDQKENISFDELSRRLYQLKRNVTTGLIDTEQIPNVENPLGDEEREKEIQRVRDFITASYPEFDESKLVISFSSGKKPMDIVVKGSKGGETKIIKDNGSGFQKSFLNLGFVKRALGPTYQEVSFKKEQEIARQKKILADLKKNSPENKGAIDDLKGRISKMKAEKKTRRKCFLQNKRNR